MNEFFLIGKVVSSYGKNGFVSTISYSDFPRRFYSLKKVYVDFFDEKKQFVVEKVRKKENSFLFKFKNFDSDSDVQVLIDKFIYINEQDAVKLPKDYFFVHDVLGSKVYQNGKIIGKVIDVLSLPANDVFVIEKDGTEILFPAVKKYIESIDAKEKVLIIKQDFDLYDED